MTPQIVPANAIVREAQISASQIIPAAVAGVNQSGQLQIVTDRVGYFIAERLIAHSTGAFRSNISDDGAGTTFQWFSSQVPKGNQPGKVDLGNLWGTAEFPHNLVTPVVMGPHTTVLIDVDDITGVANDVEVVLEGYYYIERDPADPSRYIPPAQFRKIRPDHFFGYFFTATLGAADDVEYRIVTTQDATFAVQRLVSQQTGAYDAQIGESSSGTKWDDRLIRNANKFGAYGANHFPRTLKREHFVGGNQEFTLRLHDRTGFANRIQVMLEGRKIMDR